MFPDIPTPLATLLAALFSALILSYVHRKNARRTAATKFSAALLVAFSGLYPLQSDWPKNIDSHLRQIFPSLQGAVAEFRRHVPWHRRKSFDRAWFIYRLGTDGRDIDTQVYHQYMGFTSPGEPVIDPKETFRKNVSSLIAYANET